MKMQDLNITETIGTYLLNSLSRTQKPWESKYALIRLIEKTIWKDKEK